jgi:hypothetical protein
MKIKELMENIDNLTEEQRDHELRKLLEMCCQLTKNEIRKFTLGWNTARSYEEYKTEQNKIIVKCITLETSELGAMVREGFGLGPLDPEMEITE